MDKLSGYIECEIGGEVRPIKFGMGAWVIVCEEREKNLRTMFDGLSEFAMIGWVIYAGVKFACLAGYSNQKPPENVYVVLDLISDIDTATLESITKTFMSSKISGKTMQEYVKMAADADDSDKKKAKKH